MNGLPLGWVDTRFEAIADIQLGKMLDKAKNVGVPTAYLRNINIRWGSVDTSDVRTMPMSNDDRSKFSINDGDVLVCEGGEPGRAAVWRAGPTDLKFQKAIIRLRAADGISPDWLAQYLRLAAQDGTLSERFTGTTIKHLPREALQATHLPLPPMAEQRRIVSKIGSLSAKSKRACEELILAQKLVEKYRAAILSAAFCGRLTEAWRTANPSLEASAIRIAQTAEKRARLLTGTAKKVRSAPENQNGGRVPADLGKLPRCWAMTTLENVTSPTRLTQYGILKPGDDVAKGVPYVKVMNIKNGRIQIEEIRRTSYAIHNKYARSSIKENDILLTIRGTVGRIAFVPAALDGGNITQDSVRIDAADLINRNYLFWYLHSPIARNYFDANMKGVAVRGINVGDVRLLEVPLPSEKEQCEIVRHIESALAWIGHLAAEATAARTLIDRLDQAILAKAFRGELVPQDPADEPASALLERIRAERAGAPVAKRRGRPGTSALP